MKKRTRKREFKRGKCKQSLRTNKANKMREGHEKKKRERVKNNFQNEKECLNKKLTLTSALTSQ